VLSVVSAATMLCTLSACSSTNNPVAWIKSLTGPSASELGKKAIHEDPDVRREAIIALSRRDYGDDPRILEYLVNALENDPEPSVRSAAARAIGRSGNDAFAPQLAKALQDSDEWVRWDVAVALDSVHGKEASRALMDRLANDESSDVRGASARALRHYKTLEVVRSLTRGLSDEAFNVQFQARSSLMQITGYSFGYQREDWQDVASGDLPLEAPQTSRPWWDLMGLFDDS
jgi:HEAT repeat protein